MDNVGIITEQGDLGLGYDLLNEKDAKTYNESVKDNDSKPIDESNKQ